LKLFRISDFVLRIFCPLPIGLPTLRPEQRPESAAVGDFLDPPRSVDKAKEGKFIAQAKAFRHRFSRDGYNGRISSLQRRNDRRLTGYATAAISWPPLFLFKLSQGVML
jgi:hypothetical protein